MSRQHEIPELMGKHLRWITTLISWPYKMDARTTFMDMSNWIKTSAFNFPEGWGQKQVFLESEFQWRRACYVLHWRNTLSSPPLHAHSPKTKLSGRKICPKGPERTESIVPGSRSTRMARGTYLLPAGGTDTSIMAPQHCCAHCSLSIIHWRVALSGS